MNGVPAILEKDDYSLWYHTSSNTTVPNQQIFKSLIRGMILSVHKNLLSSLFVFRCTVVPKAESRTCKIVLTDLQ